MTTETTETAHAISVGTIQFLAALGDTATSAKTSPGVAKTFSRRAASEVAGGTGGGAPGGAGLVSGGKSMMCRINGNDATNGLMIGDSQDSVEYKPVGNL